MRGPCIGLCDRQLPLARQRRLDALDGPDAHAMRRRELLMPALATSKSARIAASFSASIGGLPSALARPSPP
jgi:hypothetical protein